MTPLDEQAIQILVESVVDVAPKDCDPNAMPIRERFYYEHYGRVVAERLRRKEDREAI